jgi:hypothetical protein
MTFCRADDCAARSHCDRYLTKEIKQAAARWWGGEGAPIATFTTPKELKCYVPEENT